MNKSSSESLLFRAMTMGGATGTVICLAVVTTSDAWRVSFSAIAGVLAIVAVTLAVRAAIAYSRGNRL
jgi:opacity protein-like surface antigen